MGKDRSGSKLARAKYYNIRRSTVNRCLENIRQLGDDDQVREYLYHIQMGYIYLSLIILHVTVLENQIKLPESLLSNTNQLQLTKGIHGTINNSIKGKELKMSQ